MCGIAGIYSPDKDLISKQAVSAMVALLRHRGPDAQEVVTERHVGLGHARLSVLDLNSGQQPMSSADGTSTLVFSGEIFNYVELRQLLISRGHRFRTQSDTEVLLSAYAEYGEDCVKHFNGQWAFAIWDRSRRQLFLSRDRLGVRPLYYTDIGGRFLFASEIKSLFTDPQVSRELDPGGLRQLFTLWATLPPTTVFRDVHELPPGHSMTIAEGHRRLRRHAELDYSPAEEFRDFQECAAELRELLTDATRLRLRADVPVAAYLSGGLDSSLIAALARATTGGRLCTFSVTFPQPEFDESRYQQRLAHHLGVEHQSLACAPGDIARVFPDVVWHAEKPLLRTAPAPMFLLSQFVNGAGFKVVLTGEGADEVLGGYDIFKEAKIRRFCARQPDSARRASLLARLYPYLPSLQSQSPALKRAFFSVPPGMSDDPFFSHRPRWDMTASLLRFFSPEFLTNVSPADLLEPLREDLPEGFATWKPFCQAQYLETAVLLPGYILSSQGDRMAMAHGVEGRFPFLDHRLVEFAARIPPRWKMRGLNEKFILKCALGHLLPSEVVQRSKQPYRAPDAASFFHPSSGMTLDEYIDDLLSPERLNADGILRADAVGRLMAKAKRGDIRGARDNMALVGILSLQILIERFVRNFPRLNERALPLPEVRDLPGLNVPQITL